MTPSALTRPAAALLFAALALLAPSARADDGWNGRLRCGPIAGHAGPMSIDLHIAQSGTALSYRREMRTTDGGLAEGIESGSGTLRDGQVDLTGTYTTRGVVSQAHYHGTVTGDNMRLRGEQIWTWQRDDAPIHRRCRVELKRD